MGVTHSFFFQMSFTSMTLSHDWFGKCGRRIWVFIIYLLHSENRSIGWKRMCCFCHGSGWFAFERKKSGKKSQHMANLSNMLFSIRVITIILEDGFTFFGNPKNDALRCILWITCTRIWRICWSKKNTENQ